MFDNLTYQWVRYIHFCNYFSIAAIPASSQVLTACAQWTAAKVKSHATVVNYLSGVKVLHKLVEADTSGFSSVSLKLTLKGLRKNNEHMPRQAQLITPRLLEKIHDVLDF